MKRELARREFISRIGLGLGGLTLGPSVLNRLIGALVEKAIAETTSAYNPTGYYIHLTFPGGPPRWYFDLPLTPQGQTSSNFKPGYFGTALVNKDKTTSTEYRCIPVNTGGQTLYLPPVWAMSLAQENFSQLLNNTLMIRGMNNRINSHEISAHQQVSPIIGGTSINGSVADGSNRPLPGILDMGAPASAVFKSNTGLSATQVDYTTTSKLNPAVNLLGPFKSWYASRSVNSTEVRPIQNQALAHFDAYAQSQGVSDSQLSDMYQNAVQLVDENIFKVSDQWESTLTKYKALVQEALSPTLGTLPGLFKDPIYTAKKAEFALDSDQNVYVTHPDARHMITSQLVAPNMAENFALAELMIDKLTSNMCLGFRGLQNVVISPNKALGDVTHDQHHVGSVISTLTTTLFYRAFLGSLSQFVTVLKQKNLFDQTILHIASEFSRVPDRAGGSGHGAIASNATLISGKFKEFNVIGNIKVDHPLGTFGAAAPFAVGQPGNVFNREIQVNDVARTITVMLGAADVTTNGLILTKTSGGNIWTPTYKEAKNV